MRFRCRVRAWASLSACLGLGLISGCGGSDTPAPAPPAPAPTATAPAPTQNADLPEQASSEPASQPSGDESGAGAEAGMFAGGGGGGMPTGNGMGGMGMGGMGMAAPSSDIMAPSMGAEYGAMAGGMSGGMGMGMPGMGMGGMGGPANDDPAPAEDADYLSKGKYAFAIGKESVAEQYVIAELLANEAEAANLLQQVKFATGPRKPTFALRFAVGVNLEAPTSITDYKPIGRTQFAGANGQSGGGGSGENMAAMGGMPGGSGAPAGGGAQKSIGDLTGRFGEEFIKSFESAWDSGTFGSIFADVETIVPRNRPGGQNNRMMGMGSGMSPGGMGGYEAMTGDSSGMPGAAPGTNAPPSESLRMRATPGKAVVPGLTYLGTGKETELLGKAETEGIDYLFYFEVEVKAQRQLIQNDTRLRLIAVKDKKNMGATSTLNNNKVDREMAMKGDNDDVAKQLTTLFRKVEALKPIDMPKLSPEAAQARVKSLIEKKTKDVLPILMEIKLYHMQGSLSDEERDAAYQLTLPNGLAFANGTAEDRDFVLSPLLPGYK